MKPSPFAAMKFSTTFLLLFLAAASLRAQPSVSATTVPSREMVEDAAARRAAYLQRVQ